MPILVDSYKQLRLKMLKVILLLMTVFMFVFSFQDRYFNRIYLSTVELIIACFGFVLYITFNRWVATDKVNQLVIFFSNIVFCFLLYVLILEGFNSSSYIWLTAIPISSYMLTGLKMGQKLTLFYLGLASIILISKEILSHGQLPLEDIVDICFLVILVWILAHFYESANQLGRRELTNTAITDCLTDLNNRHAFYDYFARNKDTKIGVVMIDLDFFKAINDNYGHDAGDYVLTQVADLLIRYQDDNIKAFRLGGEEFALLTLGLNYEHLYTLANNLLIDIREHTYVYEGCILELTASLGISLSDTIPSNLDALMKSADKKLYEAKLTGRNRVVYELTLAQDK